MAGRSGTGVTMSTKAESELLLVVPSWETPVDYSSFSMGEEPEFRLPDGGVTGDPVMASVLAAMISEDEDETSPEPATSPESVGPPSGQTGYTPHLPTALLLGGGAEVGTDVASSLRTRSSSCGSEYEEDLGNAFPVSLTTPWGPGPSSWGQQNSEEALQRPDSVTSESVTDSGSTGKRKREMDVEVLKEKHVASEQKRRGKINDGLQELKALLPRPSKRRYNQAAVLHDAVTTIRTLQSEKQNLTMELVSTRTECASLGKEVTKLRGELEQALKLLNDMRRSVENGGTKAKDEAGPPPPVTARAPPPLVRQKGLAALPSGTKNVSPQSPPAPPPITVKSSSETTPTSPSADSKLSPVAVLSKMPTLGLSLSMNFLDESNRDVLGRNKSRVGARQAAFRDARNTLLGVILFALFSTCKQFSPSPATDTDPLVPPTSGGVRVLLETIHASPMISLFALLSHPLLLVPFLMIVFLVVAALGGPRVSEVTFKEARRERQKGEEHFNKGLHHRLRAQRHFRKTLKLLSQPPASLWIPVGSSVLLQLLRQLIHRLPFQLGLAADRYVSRRWYEDRILAELARTHHMLFICSYESKAIFLQQLFFALHAVNYAELSSHEMASDIYAHSAMYFRLHMEHMSGLCSLYNRVLFTFSGLPESHQGAWTLLDVSLREIYNGNWKKAKDVLQAARQATTAKTQTASSDSQFFALCELFAGTVSFLQGDLDAAMDEWARLNRLCVEHDNQFGQIHSLFCIAAGHATKRDYDEALKLLSVVKEPILNGLPDVHRAGFVALASVCRLHREEDRMALTLAYHALESLSHDGVVPNSFISMIATQSVAEVFMTLWLRSLHKCKITQETGHHSSRELMRLICRLGRLSHRAVTTIRRLGRAMPIVQPRALLICSQYHHALGRATEARQFWKQGHECAKHFTMGCEERFAMKVLAEQLNEEDGEIGGIWKAARLRGSNEEEDEWPDSLRV